MKVHNQENMRTLGVKENDKYLMILEVVFTSKFIRYLSISFSSSNQRWKKKYERGTSEESW